MTPTTEEILERTRALVEEQQTTHEALDKIDRVLDDMKQPPGTMRDVLAVVLSGLVFRDHGALAQCAGRVITGAIDRGLIEIREGSARERLLAIIKEKETE
jgi:hypothetical protein